MRKIYVDFKHKGIAGTERLYAELIAAYRKQKLSNKHNQHSDPEHKLAGSKYRRDREDHYRNLEPEITVDKERHLNRPCEDYNTKGGHNLHPDPAYKPAGRKYGRDREAFEWKWKYDITKWMERSVGGPNMTCNTKIGHSHPPDPIVGCKNRGDREDHDGISEIERTKWTEGLVAELSVACKTRTAYKSARSKNKGDGEDYDRNKKRPRNASYKEISKLSRRTSGWMTNNINQRTSITEVRAASRYRDTYHRYPTINNINSTGTIKKIIMEHLLNISSNSTHFTGRRHAHKRPDYRNERLLLNSRQTEHLSAEESPAGIFGIDRPKKSQRLTHEKSATRRRARSRSLEDVHRKPTSRSQTLGRDKLENELRSTVDAGVASQTCHGPLSFLTHHLKIRLRSPLGLM